MEIKVTAGALAEALHFVYRAADTKKTPSIPALSAVALTATAGAVTVAANNLDLYVAVTTEAEVEPGQCAVQAKPLAALVCKFPKTAMLTLVAENDVAVAVTCENSHYRLAVIPHADMPPPLEIDGAAEKIRLTADQSNHLLRTRFAASTEETRYYLNGMYLHPVDGRMLAVCTDGTVLAKADVAIADPFPKIIIPLPTVTAIMRVASDVTLRSNGKLLELRSDNTLIVSKLIDSTYPSYERVIPRPSEIWAEIERDVLLDGVERLAAIAEGNTPLGCITWNGNGVTLSLPRQEGAAHDLLQATTSGALTIGVSIEKLTTLLREIDGECVRLNAAAPQHPIRVTVPGQEYFLAVVMPMRF